MAEPIDDTLCCVCGVRIYMTAQRMADLRRNHKWFHCPNGHQQHFTGKTKEERLIEQLEREVQNLRQERDFARTNHRCPFAECYYSASAPGPLAKHLMRKHGAHRKIVGLLAAEAGPDAYGSGT